MIFPKSIYLYKFCIEVFFLQMQKLIVPIEGHFKGSVAYKSEIVLEKNKENCEQKKLMQRATDVPSSSVLRHLNFKFSGTLIHHLLLQKIKLKNDVKI